MTDKPIDFAASIALHEQALADCQAASARADQALNDYMRPILARYETTRRPGQVGTFLDRDPERERLDKEARAARSEVTRLQKKLEWLRQLAAQPA